MYCGGFPPRTTRCTRKPRRPRLPVRPSKTSERKAPDCLNPSPAPLWGRLGRSDALTPVERCASPSPRDSELSREPFAAGWRGSVSRYRCTLFKVTILAAILPGVLMLGTPQADNTPLGAPSAPGPTHQTRGREVDLGSGNLVFYEHFIRPPHELLALTPHTALRRGRRSIVTPTISHSPPRHSTGPQPHLSLAPVGAKQPCAPLRPGSPHGNSNPTSRQNDTSKDALLPPLLPPLVFPLSPPSAHLRAANLQSPNLHTLSPPERSKSYQLKTTALVSRPPPPSHISSQSPGAGPRPRHQTRKFLLIFAPISSPPGGLPKNTIS